ncbi:MAG: hypothetical protein JKY65_32155 [Planctomycetes bacterium]|nr:hypothetical protein [Planctomycetota bacterium]
MSIFESIAKRVRARSQAERDRAQAAYLTLLERLYEASGGASDPEGADDPDAVLSLLAAAGKTCEVFEADFARYRELRDIQARLASRGNVEAALSEAVAACNEAISERDRRVAELEAVVDRCAAQERILNGELDQLTRLEERCHALQRLPALKARLTSEGKPVDPFALREQAGELSHLGWAFFSDAKASA